jgi:hypothetical protein
MSALSIQPTFPIFTETDGLPLENGYIWIGVANLNPQVNPIAAYWDAALTVPAVQPIRTLNGYPSYQGTPARLYVNSDYSIQVINNKGSFVYSAPEASERISSNLVTYQPPFVGGVSTTVQDKLAQSVSVFDFGAIGDGVVNDAVAIQAAVNFATSSGNALHINPGDFLLNSDVTVPGELMMFGDGREASQFSGTGKFYLQGSLQVENIGFLGTAEHIEIATNAVGATTFGYIRVDKCLFNNSTTFSIVTESTNRNVFVEEVTILNSVFNGIGAGSGAIDIRASHRIANVHNNIIEDYNSSGGCGAIRFGQLTTSTDANCFSHITNNYIDNISSVGGTGSTYGIQVLKGYMNIIGNTVRNLINDDKDDCEGIYASGFSSRVIGNTLVDAGAGEAQITIKGGSKCNVIGNYVFQTAGRNRAPGISIQNASGSICQGNIVINPYKRGIWIDGAGIPSDVLIDGNFIQNVENDGTGFNFLGVTSGIYLANSGDQVRVTNNQIDGVVDTVTATNVACIHSTGNKVALYINNNTVTISNGDAIMISSAPLSVSVNGNDLIGTANQGFRTSTTGGVTNLQFTNNRIASTITTPVFFNGAVLPTTFTAHGNIGYLKGTVTAGVGPVASGASATLASTVTNARFGDTVKVFAPLSLTGCFATGYVSANDTVTIVVGNLTGGPVTLASGTWKVDVEKLA